MKTEATTAKHRGSKMQPVQEVSELQKANAAVLNGVLSVLDHHDLDYGRLCRRHYSAQSISVGVLHPVENIDDFRGSSQLIMSDSSWRGTRQRLLRACWFSCPFLRCSG